MRLTENFDDINQEIIQGLIEGEVAESTYLEFKGGTYGKSDSDRREFLKDVTAFANSFGGHLLIGIGEKDGLASTVEPLQGKVDQEMRRLEDMARTGVEPKIIGLRIKRVRVGEGEIIVIHIPRSPNPPHRVILKGANRYYRRNSAGVAELELEELRLLFGQQRTIEERARAFVNERFLQIQVNDSAALIPTEKGGMTIHLVPLLDFGGERRLEIIDLCEQETNLQPIFIKGDIWSYSARGINLEGVNFYNRFDTLGSSYMQLFRNGIVEGVSTKLWSHLEGRGVILPSLLLSQNALIFINCCMKVIYSLNLSLPILLQISFFGMRGVRLAVGKRVGFSSPYEREDLQLPATIIGEYAEDGYYGSIIAEQMHLLWNAYGFERCDQFDEDGNLVG